MVKASDTVWGLLFFFHFLKYLSTVSYSASTSGVFFTS